MQRIIFTLLLFGLLLPLQAQKIEYPNDVDQPVTISIRKNAHRGTSTASGFDPNLAPFYHGVASGDPTPNSVIIWTRYTPENPVDSVQLFYVVAKDTALLQGVDNGFVTAKAENDFCVKVDVTGLESNTVYYYQFQSGPRRSLIGRTKTAPSGNEEDHLRFAVVSCNNYEAGFFSGFGRIGERNDLHGVIHLGDYIYEYESGRYGDTALTNNDLRNHDTVETISLEEYRARYSLYRLDKDLRLAHQQHPFINIWDDHESANDAWKDGAENHQPDEGPWSQRKSVAQQAFYEWLPVREQQTNRLYRVLSYGDAMDLILLDTRLEGREEQIDDVTNPALYDPNRTILGSQQRDWFITALKNSSAKWKVVGNQVIFSEFHVGWAAAATGQTPEEVESTFLDIWDGYPAERTRIINQIDTAGIDNVVFLTGDFHSSFAFDVADTVTDPSNMYAPVPNYDPATGNGSVAVEFATPSITSANFDENVGAFLAQLFENAINGPIDQSLPNNIPNPHMKYAELINHGYFLLDVKADSVQANWFFVDRIDQEDADEAFGEAWYTMDGDNHLSQASAASPLKAQQDLPAPTRYQHGPLSVDQYSDLTMLRAYPNPTDGAINLQYALEKAGKVHISLEDLQGRKIMPTRTLDQSPAVYDLTLDLSGLAKGVYLLTVRTKRGQAVQRIVKE